MLLRTILGDHDLFSSEYFDGWGKVAFQDIWGNLTDADIFAQIIASGRCSFPEDCLKLLQGMPYVLEEPDYVFVHAGFNMFTDDPIHESDYIEMLWNRHSFADSSKLKGRLLVTGHVIRPLDVIKESLRTDLIRLDNGAFTANFPDMGNLVALNLDTKELTIQPWMDGDSIY